MSETTETVSTSRTRTGATRPVDFRRAAELLGELVHALGYERDRINKLTIEGVLLTDEEIGERGGFEAHGAQDPAATRVTVNYIPTAPADQPVVLPDGTRFYDNREAVLLLPKSAAARAAGMSE